MRYLIVLLLLTFFASVKSQSVVNFDTLLKPPLKIGDNYTKKLFADSLASSFYIVVRNEVKAHKHLYHSEHVLVINGKGQMSLGDKLIKIKKGDLIFIPKNTIHSVKTTSKQPLEVVSIQAPFFDGKDRISIEEK